MTRTAKASYTRIEIKPALTSREERDFLELPYRLHGDLKNWVPPLRIAQKDILNLRRHPVYKTIDAEKLIAYRGGRPVGRIMAMINHAYNRFHNERAGFFGFFETIDDFEVARSLLDSARDWTGKRGAEIIRGPVNPSTNYECGLLVEGFDYEPAVMMTYNPPYYGDLIERYGFSKAMDLYAYEVKEESFKSTERIKRVADRLRSRDRISVRPVNLKDFKREVEIVRKIYNDAWSNNWGFVPVSEEEFEHLARDLKQIVDPRIVLVAEQSDDAGSERRPIAFMLAVPDINRALKKARGRLFPFGLIKLLWHSRKIDSIRIIIMGVVKAHQSLGAAAVLYDEIYERGTSNGYVRGEMSWILENNTLMNRAAEMLGGRISKTYRIYEMPLISRH
ncbi:MAG TPA: N-acetyltransferase [Blastocatellia bacterium]|nr:N-acetyltransferase [Blastocatellia bacterium]